MNMNLNAVNRQPTFQLQNGQLDVQAKQFIKQFDNDLDGSLSQEEVVKSSGLMGAVQTKVSSPQLAQALWASIAGPTNTINAKEYAAFLLRVDGMKDGVPNGVITQDEVDDWLNRASQAVQAKSPGVNAVARNYNNTMSNGNQLGLDKVFGTSEEEQLAMGEIEQQDQETLIDTPSISKKDLWLYSTAEVGDNPDKALALIKGAKLQIFQEIDELSQQSAGLEPDSLAYKNIMKQLDQLQIVEKDLFWKEKVASQFSLQVSKEVANQGVGNNTSPELDAFRTKAQPVVDKLFADMTKEKPNSPKYNLLNKQIHDIDDAEYALYIKANPEVAQIVKEISAKNTNAIQDETWELEDSIPPVAPNTFSRISERQNIQRGNAKSFQLVLLNQAKEQMNNTIKSIVELIKDLDTESPTYQSLMARLNAIEQIKKSLDLQQQRIQFHLEDTGRAFTEPSAEMKQYLELAKTVEPEGAEYNKIMAKVQELANTHYNLDGSNPSSLPTTSTSDDLPLFSGTTLKISSITSTTTPANDDIGLPLV
jgi:hypothetical protein